MLGSRTGAGIVPSASSQIDQELVEGADALLSHYIGVEEQDGLLLCYTPDSREQAALVLSCASARGIPFRAIPMMPLEDLGFPARLQPVLGAAFSCNQNVRVLTLERDTMSHSDVLRDLLRPYDVSRYSVHRVMSSSDDLFRYGFNVTPSELESVNAALLSRFSTARQLRIMTPSGSDLKVELDSSIYRWISNRGSARPGAMTVLPAGEIATFPKAISGKFVADFAFNINTVVEASVSLRERPLSFEIEGGEACNFMCSDPELLGFLIKNLSGPFAYRVGELGFGTNPCVSEPLAHNSHLNERKRGVHLGLGQHNQSAKSDYHCDVHLDLIAEGGTVWIDDDPLPIDLAAPPSGGVHPLNVMEEDVLSPYSVDYEGDCCGLERCSL